MARTKFPTAVMKTAALVGSSPGSTAGGRSGRRTIPGEDQRLTKRQAKVGAENSGGRAFQDPNNNNEWVFGPKTTKPKPKGR